MNPWTILSHICVPVELAELFKRSFIRANSGLVTITTHVFHLQFNNPRVPPTNQASNNSVQGFIKNASVKKSKLPFLIWMKLTQGPGRLFEKWIMLSSG